MKFRWNSVPSEIHGHTKINTVAKSWRGLSRNPTLKFVVSAATYQLLAALRQILVFGRIKVFVFDDFLPILELYWYPQLCIDARTAAPPPPPPRPGGE